MMKVTHIAKMTSVAGMETHLLALLPGLRAQGVDANLIILVESGKPLDQYVAEMHSRGVPVETVTIRRDFDPGVISQLGRNLRSIKPDAVHTHLIHADLHGVLAAKWAGVKRIYLTGHNDDRFRRLWPVRLLQGWMWRQIEAGITISRALRDFVIKFEFAPPECVHIVHYGLEPVRVEPGDPQRLRLELGLAPNAPVVGSVCRLIEQKGITHALRAFWEISEQSQGAQYVIVGEGPLRQRLEQEANAYGLGQRVHFLGWLPNANRLMAAFDVLLVPSLWEGFGIVALEAMAASIPVIASQVSALPEIVANGETGYLAAPGDSSSLAEHLLHIFQNPAMAREMGQNGRRRLESEFSVERMVEGTLKVYHA